LATSFVVGNTLFLLLHETGRVHISQVHLPVLHVAVVLGQARPLHATERPWTSYSAISPFSDSTSDGGCRFSGVWPRCTRFGSLDSGRVIRDVARGTGDAGLRIGFTSVPHTWACARTCSPHEARHTSPVPPASGEPRWCHRPLHSWLDPSQPFRFARASFRRSA
jgi:hypothetical protein